MIPEDVVRILEALVEVYMEQLEEEARERLLPKAWQLYNKLNYEPRKTT